MPAPNKPDSDQITDEAALAMLEPLAGLLLSRRMRFAQAEDLLKTAYLIASARAYVAQGEPATVSALSVATGIRRREVDRLFAAAPGAEPPPVSQASQVRLRWMTDPQFADDQGQPRRLARTAPGDAPSFARLASLVSTDIHHRALLTEMIRIHAVMQDGEYITLLGDQFIPSDREDELLRVAGNNVSDHLSATLVNLLSDEPPMTERAVIADGLTRASAQKANEIAQQIWIEARSTLRDKLQTLVDLDKDVPGNDWRVRVGMYGYYAPQDRPMPELNKRHKSANKKPGAKKATNGRSRGVVSKRRQTK